MGMVLVVAMAGAIITQQSGSYSRVQTNPPGEGINVYDAEDPRERTLTSIDWGTLSPGQTANHDALIVNGDPTKTYTLTVTASEWNPANATDYMAFSYNDYGQTLHTQMGVRFTLEVYENCTGITWFSFTITLNFEEVT